MTQLINLRHFSRIARCGIKAYTSTHSISVFRTIRKINSDFCPMQHSPTVLSNGRTLYSLQGAQRTFWRNVRDANLEVLTEVLMKGRILYVRPC